MGGSELFGTFITTRQGKLVVKLDSGYNIGVEPQAVSVRETPAPAKLHPLPISQRPDLAELSIISTGGTIASRIDYRTGAVTSQFSAEDILRAVPRLGELARFRAHQIATILSENMTAAIWEELAGRIHDEIQDGVPGIIVTHGTDTMSYTAAAMSFMVQTPVPVIFVGSQRSADRPSSDNVMNALCSASAALGDLGEVAVVMHGTTSDDFCAIHRATRVRKMHTSRRDAFRSVGIPPIGRVDYPSLEVLLESEAVRRDTRPLAFHGGLEERVGFLFFHPGISPEIIASLEGYRGLVVAGSGLGHVSTACIPALEALIDIGTHVVMTSQCMHGRVCDRVYDTGRDLLSIGVIEGEDMLPETAMVKLMWVLAREDDPGRVRNLMQTDLAGEIRRCSAHGL